VDDPEKDVGFWRAERWMTGRVSTGTTEGNWKFAGTDFDVLVPIGKWTGLLGVRLALISGRKLKCGGTKLFESPTGPNGPLVDTVEKTLKVVSKRAQLIQSIGSYECNILSNI